LCCDQGAIDIRNHNSGRVFDWHWLSQKYEVASAG
jgi:hypothetical protein